MQTETFVKISEEEKRFIEGLRENNIPIGFSVDATVRTLETLYKCCSTIAQETEDEEIKSEMLKSHKMYLNKHTKLKEFGLSNNLLNTKFKNNV